jgi:hypothetical protein
MLSGPKGRSKVGSIYQLSKLKRMPSGAWKGRKAIPQAVRGEYQRLYGPGVEAIFWSPAGTSLQQAKTSYAEWQAQIGRRITALQEAEVGRGQDLTQRQADALAGGCYRRFVGQHLDNPGQPQRWAGLRETLYTEIADCDPETGEVDLEHPNVLKAVAVECGAEQFLIDRGLTLTEAARRQFHCALVHEFLAAAETLERRANGDWGPDYHEAELAPVDHISIGGQQGARGASNGSVKNPRCSALTAVELFQAWAADTHPAPGTINDGGACLPP